MWHIWFGRLLTVYEVCVSMIFFTVWWQYLISSKKDQFFFCICVDLGPTMAIQYMVFLPRGLRVRYLYLVFVTRNGDSCVVFPLCVRQARPRVWRSQLAWCGQWSCGVVCDCVCVHGVVVNGHVACSLFRPRKDQYAAYVLVHILFNTKRSTQCQQCGACSLKYAQQYSCQWPGGVCDL